MASRVRTRPQSWHGSDIPPGSANGGGSGDAGAMQPPMSAMSARSGSGYGSVVGGSVSGSSSKGRAVDHMLFFSVCQATFYVMCFRGDELAAMEGFGDKVPLLFPLLAAVSCFGAFVGGGRLGGGSWIMGAKWAVSDSGWRWGAGRCR